MSQFYATFDGKIKNRTILEMCATVFDTAAERDEWINFEDAFSISRGLTKENAYYDRFPLERETIFKEGTEWIKADNAYEIKDIVNRKPNYHLYSDIENRIDKNQKWLFNKEFYPEYSEIECLLKKKREFTVFIKMEIPQDKDIFQKLSALSTDDSYVSITKTAQEYIKGLIRKDIAATN